ncbi:MAG: hypothetical protein EPN97_12895 [Alphaproteobacteria bacterium]|nr:MAG: hypothetical protein EPN97_12895 [Alphaproteobacteria bacterium]
MGLFPPLGWARKAFNWLAEKPNHQYTLGSLFTKNKLVTWPLCRGARFCERAMMGAMLFHSLPAILGLVAGAPFTMGATLPALAVLAFNIKCDAVAFGLMGQLACKSGKFLTEVFDQIFNGADEYRPAKFDKKSGQPQPQPQSSGPSVLDKMVALGHAFNGPARQGGPLGGTVIWGGPSTSAPEPSTVYDGAVKTPSTEQLDVANGRREGVERMISHPNEHPTRHQEPPTPPPPVFKPGCDNN